VQNYYLIGDELSKKIDMFLSEKCLEVAFATGGGYAYRSIKYKNKNHEGDFDFNIIYKHLSDIEVIKNGLIKSGIDFIDNINNDIFLLKSDRTDIIRVTGKYKGIKTSINLVPLYIVESIVCFDSKKFIRKVAHGRNLGFYYAYGTDGKRCIVNMLCTPLNIDTKQLHYNFLDISCFIKNNNLYISSIADVFLKAHESHYDNIGFQNLRKHMIAQIKYFFIENCIPIKNYLYIYANNYYFDKKVKKKLIQEFNKILPIIITSKLQTIDKHIIYLIESDRNPQNEQTCVFIKNNVPTSSFEDYIIKREISEYEEQYLIDALCKFFGYIYFNDLSDLIDMNYYDIFPAMYIYNQNDIYLENMSTKSINDILRLLTYSLCINKKISNRIKYLFIDMIIEFAKFKMIDCKTMLHDICIFLNKDDLNILLFSKMKNDGFINKILKAKTFQEVGMLHNYYSYSFEKYTQNEVDFLKSIIIKNEKILDVMCGFGRIGNKLFLDGYTKIEGIDIYSYDIEKKLFNFINADIFNYYPSQLFDVAFCLYGNYKTISSLKSIINKIKEFISPNGKFVIDIPNADWRKNNLRQIKYNIYEDESYILTLKRNYSKITKIEKSVYLLYKNEKLLERFVFFQRYFYADELKRIFISDFEMFSSGEKKTRNDDQRIIIKGMVKK